MDEVRKLVVSKAAILNRSLSELSRSIGKNHAYLQQFIHRDTPADLPEEVRIRLAPALGVSAEDLIGGKTRQKLQMASLATQERQVARLEAPIPVSISGSIPVYGQAEAGDDGRFILNGNRIADVIAPPSLQGVRDAYAVYVVGDSMEPRYQAGEAIYVNPRLPVRRGDYVVVQVAGDEGEPPSAFIKRFISRDAAALVLEQFNPPKKLRVPVARVVSVHRIVMAGDG